MKPGILLVMLCLVTASASWNAFAGDGHDHGDEGSAPVGGNGPRRLPDGSVFLPKPAQRQIGVRTLVDLAGHRAQVASAVMFAPNNGLVLASSRACPIASSKVAEIG